MIAAGLAGTVPTSISHSCGGTDSWGPLPETTHDVEADGLLALDRRLAASCRERRPLRAFLARIACRLVDVRAWERIGYARLSDYAVERLGYRRAGSGASP